MINSQIFGQSAKGASLTTAIISNVVRPLAVGLGGILTAVDIGVLIHSLSTDHPVASILKNQITQIREKRLKCDNMIVKFENFMLRNCLEYSMDHLNEAEAQLKVEYGNKEKELERKCECKLDQIKEEYDNNLKNTEKCYQNKINGLDNKVKELQEKNDQEKQCHEERISKLEDLIDKLQDMMKKSDK